MTSIVFTDKFCKYPRKLLFDHSRTESEVTLFNSKFAGQKSIPFIYFFELSVTVAHSNIFSILNSCFFFSLNKKTRNKNSYFDNLDAVTGTRTGNESVLEVIRERYKKRS